MEGVVKGERGRLNKKRTLYCRLTSLLRYNFFASHKFPKCRDLGISCGFIFTKEIFHENTSKNLERYFNFVFRVLFSGFFVLFFAKNLEISKIEKFHSREKTVT